ncbi:polysaccharide biosynthesis/export family protein [Dyadobacter sp. NIV53]|uniref:polysaccharide biosynthesis/export family protein n=1 Tax=Dyadobacter sp. NIV53 TaxID=2861765 RepID=UPI001E62CC37|nr:polysaccharide biosynthesis/export family protein [Dyadobacter sp. NIV53]
MHYLSYRNLPGLRITFFFILLVNTIAIGQNQIPSLPQQTPGQSSPASGSQAVEFYNQAKSAGMSDLDIEKAALQRGYTLDQISTMRKRIQPGEKEVKDPNRDELDETRDQDELDEEANNQRDSTGLRRAYLRRLNRTFGSAFFATSTNTFEPNLRIATPRNYILGPEDELVVDIYGNSVDNFRMKISPEGTSENVKPCTRLCEWFNDRTSL